MKKSTKIRFCTIPKYTDCKILKCRGKNIWDTDIVDKITDDISNPYIQIALEGLGWINKVEVLTRDSTVTKPVYIVVQRDLLDMSYDVVADVLLRIIPSTQGVISAINVSEIFEVMYGIQYMLSIKSKLGIDVCIIDGNTFDDCREES